MMKINAKELAQITGENQTVANGFLKMAAAIGMIPQPEKVKKAGTRGKPTNLFNIENCQILTNFLSNVEDSVPEKPTETPPTEETEVQEFEENDFYASEEEYVDVE